jgi:hypothetical protein
LVNPSIDTSALVSDELIPMSCEPPCMMEPQAVSVTSAKRATMSRFLFSRVRYDDSQYISYRGDESAL